MPFETHKIIDITQPLYDGAPSWDGCALHLTRVHDYDKLFRTQKIEMPAGAGTHIDAPAHIKHNGPTVDQLAIQDLVMPLRIIDVSSADSVLHTHDKYQVTEDDIRRHEKLYGKIPKGAGVLLHTGWNRLWRDPAAYRNEDREGRMHFPSCSQEAAKLLFERGIRALGIDTLSPDCDGSNFPVHRLFLPNDICIIENIGSCSYVPPQGALLMVSPMKIENATEAPARVVALIPY